MCNVECGSTIDASLNRSFAVLCVMLAIESDRGPPGSLLVTDADGRKVILDPGLVPREGGAPTTTVDGDRILIRAGTQKQTQEVIASLERKHGKKLKIESAMRAYDFASRIDFNFNVDNDLFLRSSVKTALVFAEARAPELTDALRPAWDYVAGRGAVDRVFDVQFTAQDSPWVQPELGPVAHRLLVDADVARGEVLFDIRFFGELAIRSRVTGKIPAQERRAYGIDPTSRRQVEAATWNGSIALDTFTTEQLNAHTLRAFEQVFHVARDVERLHLSKRITREALAEIDPSKDPVGFSQRVAEKVAVQISRQRTEKPDPVLAEKLRARLGRK